MAAEGVAVTRSLGQNDCLHKWCGLIAEHLQAGGAPVSKDMVKEIILLGLGNTIIKGLPGMGEEKIAMRSHSYKQFQSDLTEKDHRLGFISMDELLTAVAAWAATDLDGLILERDEDA